MSQNILFIDGPPFPTGTPHLGHITTGFLKDMMIRQYKSNPDTNVKAYLGWDCHGQSIENEVDRLFSSGLTTAQKMNECKNRVHQHITNWKKIYNMMGRDMDGMGEFYTMSDDYKKMSCQVFKELWDKGYVYQDRKIMLFSFATQTPVSHIDATQSMKEIDVMNFLGGFKMEEKIDNVDTYLLVNTSNIYQLCYHQGLGVNSNYKYWLVRLNHSKIQYICQENYLQQLLINRVNVVKIRELKVDEFENGRYYIPCPNINSDDNVLSLKIINFWNLSEEEDTGFHLLVHTQSEEEYHFLNEKEVPYSINGYYENAKILSLYPNMYGRSILEIEPVIMQMFQKNINGNIVFMMKKKVVIPTCLKSEQRLFNYPVPSWFIRVVDKRDLIKERLNDISFLPENKIHLERWIDESKDWCISRNRNWGCSIPIYKTIDGEVVCYDRNLSQKEITDNGLVEFSPLVFDSWFESSLVFIYLEKLNDGVNFDKRIVVESVEQHRGWFYTQLVMATLLGKDTPMTHIITHGSVLSETGYRMCKTKNNLPSIYNLFNQFGADYMRIMLSNSSQPKDSFKFKDIRMYNQYRNTLLFQKNCFIFLKQNVDLFCSYSNLSFELMSVDDIFRVKRDYLSHWMIQEMFDFQMQIKCLLESGSFLTIWDAIELIQDNISKWYIKLKKPAFKDMEGNARVCISTLFWSLYYYCRVCEPVMPYLGVEFRNSLLTLNIKDLNELKDDMLRYSVVVRNWREDVKNLKQIITMAKIIRHQNKHKNIHLFHTEPNHTVKMPIHKLILIHPDAKIMKALQDLREYIYQEVNAIHIEYLLQESKYIDTQLKLNYKMDLGEASSLSRDIFRKASNISPEIVSKILRNKEMVKIHFQEKMVELPISYFMIRRSKKEGLANYDFITHKNLSILIDKEINEDMIYIYEAKLLIRQIQNLRRLGQLVPSDRIKIYYSMKGQNERLKYILENQMKYIYPSLQIKLEDWSEEAKPFIEDTLSSCDTQVDIGIEKVLEEDDDKMNDINEEIEFEEDDEVLL